jgi:hypothetical protein
MNQAEAEAHLPDQVLPEVDDIILPDYDLVDLQDLQPGSFYFMGGNGGRFVGPSYFNLLAEYEDIQGDDYIFTFYKARTKAPLGPWVDNIEQGVDFPIASFQNKDIRLYKYSPGMNLGGNNNMEGGTYKRFKSYKTRKATRKALKKRVRKTRRNH